MNDLPEITSRDNQRLVQARKVRDGNASGRMFIEGKRLTSEALRSGIDISVGFVSRRFVASSENKEILATLATEAEYLFELPDHVFATIAATDNSQGVVLIAERPENSSGPIERSLSAQNTLAVVLLMLRINNPSNLGAVLRSAEAAGVAGLIISSDSADVFSPKALRASMGSAFRLPIWYGVSPEQALVWADRFGLLTTAVCSGSGVPYTSADLRVPRLVVFGSEAHGIETRELDRMSDRLMITMENDVESLNLAVAAGIVLFEARRQLTGY